MLGRKFLPKICMLGIGILFSSTLLAQGGDEGLSGGPSGRPFTTGQENIFEDGFYDYDAQLWAPVDYTSINGRQDMPTGFYGSYDISYLSVSRPGAVPGVSNQLYLGGNTWHWGKNYSVGFMSEAGRGIDLNWQNLDGSSIVQGTSSNSAATQLLNLAYDTVELNRVFRECVGPASYIEPFIGLRYTRVADNTVENTTIQIGTNQQHHLVQRVQNSALGGQIGARLVQQRGRFTYECDCALAGAYNRQRYSTYARLVDVNGVITEREVTNESTVFLPTLDLAGKVQYEITRDVSVRFGLELQFLWEGVARADTRPSRLNPHGLVAAGNPVAIEDEHFLAAGINFGLDWRR